MVPKKSEPKPQLRFGILLLLIAIEESQLAN